MIETEDQLGSKSAAKFLGTSYDKFIRKIKYSTLFKDNVKPVKDAENSIAQYDIEDLKKYKKARKAMY